MGTLFIIWAWTQENMFLLHVNSKVQIRLHICIVCQRLYYLLAEKYFRILVSSCTSAGWFEISLVTDHFMDVFHNYLDQRSAMVCMRKKVLDPQMILGM